MNSERRLETEEQIAPANVIAQEELDTVLDHSNLRPEVQALIERMLAGIEPYGRDLKAHEVKKFSPMHINIATLRAAGFKGTEIIQITGCGKQHVYLTLIHPYAKKLIQALVPQNSVRVIDIRTRLDEYAGELLDKTFGLALVSEDFEQVTKVTFGLLDRAGFSAKEVASSKPDGREIPADASTMRRLLSAMEGSKQVDEQIMPHYVGSAPPDEILPEVGSEEELDATPVASGSPSADAASQRKAG
jgi:hypothetical protein